MNKEQPVKYKDNGTGFQCEHCGMRKDLHRDDKSCPSFGEAVCRSFGQGETKP